MPRNVRNVCRRSLPGLVTAILIAVTAGAWTHPRGAQAADALSQTDREFLGWDIQIEIQQQDMGHLAEQRGQSADVRNLGTYLVERHRQAEQRLRQVAETLQVTLSDRLSAPHLQIQRRYATVPSATFDKAFVAHETGDYRYFLSHFEPASRTENLLIRSYCTGELPRLKEDQARIAALARAMEGGRAQ